MISGIIFFESGGIQQIGDLNSVAGIINTIKQVLPELEAKEASRVLDQISDDELEKLLEVRKSKSVEK